MDERLRDYQKVAVEFLELAGGRAILGDDVGTGKTVEALGWAWANRSKLGRILVVAPATVIYKWGREVETWTGWDHQVVSSSKDDFDPAFIHVMSYDIMRRCLRKLLPMGYSLVILDEFHYVKNWKAQRTRSAKVLCKNVPYVLGLSGTPMLNRPMELFTMLNILDPQTWKSYWKYGNRYCGGQHKSFKGATNLAELRQRLQPYMIRRMKSEVRSQMPPVQTTILPVKVDLKEYHKVSKNVREAILAMSPNSKGYWVNVLDKLNLLRQAVGQAKIPAVVEWSENFLNNSDKKLVIYAHHINVVATLSDHLEKYGVLSITGSVPNKERDRRALAFQKDDVHRVMIVSQAGGIGQDLFGIEGNDCSNLLVAELPWRSADIDQAVGRLDREGQTLPVNMWILSAKRTIDRYILRAIVRKEGIIDATVGTNSLLRDVTREFLS